MMNTTTEHRIFHAYNFDGTIHNAHCICGWVHRDGGPGARHRADTADRDHLDTRP